MGNDSPAFLPMRQDWPGRTGRSGRRPGGQPNSSSERTEPEQNDENDDDPVSVPASSAALVAVCPAPPSCILAVHGPLVRRRPATSPAGTASTRACSQVRPGRSRRARRRSDIGQRRRRPATVPPRRRHAKKEHCVLNFSSHPPPTNHSACRRPCPPLHSSPGCSVIGQWRWRAATVLPRHVIFVVAQKRRIGKNPILYLFYLSFLVRLLTVQLAVVVVLLFCSLRMPIALSASRRPPRSCRGA